MTDPREVFPERLRERMEHLGATAKELANGKLWMQGVTETEVERWLDGTGFPCPRKFYELQQTLGVTRDQLLT